MYGNNPAFHRNMGRQHRNAVADGDSRRNPVTDIPGFALYEETGSLRRTHSEVPAGSCVQPDAMPDPDHIPKKMRTMRYTLGTWSLILRAAPRPFKISVTESVTITSGLSLVPAADRTRPSATASMRVNIFPRQPAKP